MPARFVGASVIRQLAFLFDPAPAYRGKLRRAKVPFRP
jgi:hypothetical protein